MFERFSSEARSVVVAAQDEARALRHRFIGTEHLLLAMLAQGGLGGRLLAEYGLSAGAVREQLRRADGADTKLDPAALATLGIDLGEVRRAAEEQFGPGALAANSKPIPQGHIRFSKRAKKALELGLREAVALNSDSINSVHLLLGIIGEGSGVGLRLISGAGVDIDALQADARIRAAQQAA
jgi:ATP-dependent Clp protease ATP-binding subunit ClpA